MEHYYIVNGDSILGIRIKQYFQRCELAERDIDAFVQSLPDQYGMYPLDINTQICYADDCDAGGLLRLSFPISLLAESSFKPDTMVWESFPDPDDDDRVCYAPRIQPQSRFVRYGQAVKMNRRPDWKFVSAPPSLVKRGLPFQIYNYGDVQQHIQPDNRKELQHKGKDPSYSMRLALGTHLTLVHDGITYLPESLYQDQTTPLNIEGQHVEYISDERFDLALKLYRAWTELPSVPANTLARTLALDWHGLTGKDSVLREHAYCHCIPDSDHNRFIVYTGLTSHLVDMKEVNPTPDILEAFNRKL